LLADFLLVFKPGCSVSFSQWNVHQLPVAPPDCAGDDREPYRFSEGKVNRLADLAAELVRLNCDVIVTTGTEAAEAAKKVINTVPVVMAFGG